jgi:hypothetical protein
MHTHEMPEESLDEESCIQVRTFVWLQMLSELQEHIFQSHGKNSFIMLNAVVTFTWELPYSKFISGFSQLRKTFPFTAVNFDSWLMLLMVFSVSLPIAARHKILHLLLQPSLILPD